MKGLFVLLLAVAVSGCGEAITAASGDSDESGGGSSGGSSSSTRTVLAEGVSIDIGDEWLYRKGDSTVAADWITVAYDDSDWSVGGTGMGYGDADDETILSDMRGSYVTVYTRMPIVYDGSFPINSLLLEIDYDDGFVAYINGQEVARANMPAGQPTMNTLALTPIDPGTVSTYDLSGFISLIGNGDNVLAVEVHNATLSSSDLSFLPRLLVNTVASQPPVVTISSGGGTYVQGDTVNLRATATDAEDGTINSSIEWSSSLDGVLPGGGRRLDTNALSVGTHTITASVTDSDGNSAADTTTVTISVLPPPNQPPVVNILGGSGSYDEGDTVNLVASATDAEDGTITSSISWSSSLDGAIPGSGGSVDTNALSVGTHVITASVTDSDGDSDSDTMSVTIDPAPPVSQPPVVNITSGNGTYTEGDMVTFTGTATDAEDGTITGDIRWSSSLDGPIPGSGGSVNTNSLSVGSHTITASVTDSDGNTDTDTRSVTINATPPPPGSFSLDDFVRVQGMTRLNYVWADLSGMTYNPDTDTFYMIQNNGGDIWEVDTSYNLIRSISNRGGFGDSEDIAYLRNDEFAIVSEEGYLYIGTIPRGTTDITIDSNDFQAIRFASDGGNSGPEGVTYDITTQTFYIVKEENPRRLYSFVRPAGSADTTVTPTQPFNAETTPSPRLTQDMSGVTFNPDTGRLLILSDRDTRVIDIDLNGNVYGILELQSGQHEGIAFDSDMNLHIVAEPYYYSIYRQQ